MATIPKTIAPLYDEEARAATAAYYAGMAHRSMKLSILVRPEQGKLLPQIHLGPPPVAAKWFAKHLHGRIYKGIARWTGSNVLSPALFMTKWDVLADRKPWSLGAGMAEAYAANDDLRVAMLVWKFWEEFGQYSSRVKSMPKYATMAKETMESYE